MSKRRKSTDNKLDFDAPAGEASGGDGVGGGAGVAAVALHEAAQSRYLNYALSVITARALPDVRDGLKPVHRRLLFAMRQLRLDPGQAFKKSARVVGDVIGKYHPHGDQSVYDALVRLAQDFAQRYPLVDGQGNFGNIDGDNPAAMRYTESRMTEVARMCDRAGIGACLLLDDGRAATRRPDTKLFDGGGAEGVARGQHHLLAGVCVTPRQFSDGRGLARAVHTHHQQHERALR